MYPSAKATDIIAAIIISSIMSWLASIWDSTASLSLIITRASWIAAFATLIGLICTAITIVARGRKDDLTKIVDGQREERISKSYEIAESAKSDAAKANAEAEQSKTERVKLELQVQELTKSNLSQRRKLLELEEDQRPRSINPTQRQNFLAAIKTLSSSVTAEVKVQVYARESEADTFANRLIELFNAAGFKTSKTIVLDGSGTGMGFAIKQRQNLPPLVAVLASAFNSAGMPFGIVDVPALAEGDFFVFVGARIQRQPQ